MNTLHFSPRHRIHTFFIAYFSHPILLDSWLSRSFSHAESWLLTFSHVISLNFTYSYRALSCHSLTSSLPW